MFETGSKLSIVQCKWVQHVFTSLVDLLHIESFFAAMNTT